LYNAIITGMSAATKSIRTPGIYSGIVGVVSNDEFRKNNARFHRLGNLMDRVKAWNHIKRANREKITMKYVMGYMKYCKYLPHRYPFLLIDRGLQSIWVS
jgi:hypothetical protein